LVFANCDSLHEYAERELEEPLLQLDLRRCRGRSIQPPHHGVHLTGDDAGHAADTVRREELHGRDAVEGSPVRAIAARGEH
jgi:hypothetical protein